MADKLPLFFAFTLCTILAAEEPWSLEESSPVTREVSRVIQHEHAEEQGGILDFFRTYLSPLDGSRCYYNPTCSRYAQQAIKKYGIIQGLLMTSDRLQRCHPEQRENRNDPAVDFYRHFP